MSRALDQKTLLALSESNQQVAYEAISKALAPPPDGLLELEILPKSHVLKPGQCLVADHQAIAISKTALVAAFFMARRRLFAYLESPHSSSEEDVFSATAVILMMDAEHLTAANTRKRLIAAALARKRNAMDYLRREERLMLSILTSRLHRHTKSPTLWGHLRWVMEESMRLGLSLNDISQTHVSAVFVAAERHPRNYYAWCYARWLVITQAQAPSSVRALVDVVKDWCVRHHTDTSGWSFLYFLLSYDESSEKGPLAAATLGEVSALVASLKWTNEAVWVFLRTLAASGLAGEQAERELQGVLTTLSSTVTDGGDMDEVARAVLDRAFAWPIRYGTGASRQAETHPQGQGPKNAEGGE